MPIALSLMLLAAAVSQTRDAGTALYAHVADSVLLVIVENSRGEVIAQGSAFVIEHSRLVTNAHVIREGKVFVKGGAFKIPCTVEQIDDTKDLAILKPSIELSARPLRLALKVPPSGSTIYALGNPQGLERTITQGLLTGIRTVKAQQLLQLSAAISPGSSGGPVVLPSGDVIGVATYSVTEGQNLNFAVPVADVRALLVNGADSLLAPQSPLKPPASTTPKVIAALEQSKLRYEKSKEGVWFVTLPPVPIIRETTSRVRLV